MNQQSSRMKFSEIDDIKLIKLVDQMEKLDWKKISILMKKWTPRQCRDRYNNYLSPHVQNKKWTKEEEKILLDKYSIYGPKWSFLTRFFHNRAAVNIKNHYTKLSFKNTQDKEKYENYQIGNNNSKKNEKKVDILDYYNDKNPIFKFDINEDDSQFEVDNDYLDFPIGFFSNEIFNFII